MITFTQGYTRAADIVGISLTQNTQDLTNIKQDINQGLRLFKNAARRYWTRAEKQTNIVANQQYYQMPPDCVRVTQIRVNLNGLTLPLVEIDSEEKWNKINVIPSATINMPTYYFVKGANEIGLWPTPATNATNGLLVSYEPRLVDMTLDDLTTGTVSVTNGSTAVTLVGTTVTSKVVGQWFQVTDGTDGNWYQITAFVDNTHVTLGNDYAGATSASATYIIGQAADIPEDYHMALIYYACYNFFLKRKDSGQALNYKSLFDDLLQQFKETYAAKSTGQVQNDMTDMGYNIFQIPPTIS
jgi:hypothetical protein